MGCSSQLASHVAACQYADNAKSAKESKCNQYRRSTSAKNFPQSKLCPIHILKNKLGYPGRFFTHNLPCCECSKGHITCPVPCYLNHNRYSMSKTCITWTQIAINDSKVKTNREKGRLGEKSAAVF